MDFRSDHPETELSKLLGMSVLRIATSYVDGFTSLKTLSEILHIQKLEQERYLTFPHFFSYLYGISYQSMVINLSNIIVEDKDSINIYYLSSLIANLNEKSQKTGNYSELDQKVANFCTLYAKDSEFYVGVKELRDKYIAHIDRSRFHHAKGITRSISLDDFNKAYEHLGNLVGSFIGILGINPDLIDFEQLDKANLQLRSLITNIIPKPLV
jgi:hypothetical protein